MDWDSGEIAGKVLLSIRLINSSGYAGHRKARTGKGKAMQGKAVRGKGDASRSTARQRQRLVSLCKGKAELGKGSATPGKAKAWQGEARRCGTMLSGAKAMS